MAIYTGSSKHLGGTETVARKETFYYGLVRKNVLITGAEGQLGHALRELKEDSSNAFRFIYTDAGQLDITDYLQVADFVEYNAPAYIVNCAAYTDVDKAETEPEKAYEVNAAGAGNLARAAAQNGCRLIHISTDYVFDGTAQKPYRETDIPHPLSVYGDSKLKGEQAIMRTTPDCLIIRTAWLYSQFGGNFVKTMLRLMNQRSEIGVVSDQYGTPTYATDLAEMIVHILEFSEDREWKPGIYHFSNRGETTWFGFAERIRQAANIGTCRVKPLSTAQYNAPARRPMYGVLDKSKIESAFDVVIPSWEEALERCLRKWEDRSL